MSFSDDYSSGSVDSARLREILDEHSSLSSSGLSSGDDEADTYDFSDLNLFIHGQETSISADSSEITPAKTNDLPFHVDAGARADPTPEVYGNPCSSDGTPGLELSVDPSLFSISCSCTIDEASLCTDSICEMCCSKCCSNSWSTTGVGLKERS